MFSVIPNVDLSLSIVKIGGCLGLICSYPLFQQLSKTFSSGNDSLYVDSPLQFVELGDGNLRFTNLEETREILRLLKALHSSLKSSWEDYNGGRDPTVYMGDESRGKEKKERRGTDKERSGNEGEGRGGEDVREGETSRTEKWETVSQSRGRRLSYKKPEERHIWDLDSIVNSSELPLPTINGWMLGYPIVYHFSKDKGQEAAATLSSNQLNRFCVFLQCNALAITENVLGQRGEDQNLLLSFTCPSPLSSRESKEEWVQIWFNSQTKISQVWESPHLSCTLQPMQSIAL